MVVHPLPTLRAVQQARQGIGNAQRIRPLFAFQRALSKLPCLLGDDGLMRVFKDHPLLLGVGMALVPVKAFPRTEVDRMPHILLMRQNPCHRHAVPVMRMGFPGVVPPEPAGMLCKVKAGIVHPLGSQNARDLIRPVPLAGHLIDAPDNVCRLLVDEPVVLVLRVLAVTVDAVVVGRLTGFAAHLIGGSQLL